MPQNEKKSPQALLDEIEVLKRKLSEAEGTLNAIRNGEVDVLIVSGKEGEKIFTLEGADFAYRNLIETMNEGALTLDPDGIVMYCNQRMAEMLGVPMKRIIGSSFDPFIDPKDLPVFSRNIWPTFLLRHRHQISYKRV